MAKRIPFEATFTGQYNSRVTESLTATTASGYVGIGIVGIMVVGDRSQTTDRDERYINCFLTKDGTKDYIVKRPGYDILNTPSAGNIGTAIHIWASSGSGNSVITAFGATNSTIYSGTSSLGAITGKARGISETFVGSNVATLAIASTDSTGWYYDVATGSATKITDGDFPGNASQTTAGNFAHVDGYNLIMTTIQRLYASDSNSITAWTSNSYDTANQIPGIGIGCVVWKNYVMAFSTNHVEFWTNAGLTPFPFQRSKSMTIKVGAVSSDAIATLSDNVFWAGSTEQGGISIFQFDGAVRRISTPAQDYQLLLAGTGNISLTTERYFGKSFVVVVANTVTYVYCIEDQRWHERLSAIPLWYKSAGISTGTQLKTYSISKISTSGSVFVIDPSAIVYTDNGTAFTSSAQSQNKAYGNGNRVFFDELEIICDIQSSASNITIAYSDDDYQTFVTAGTIDASSQKKLFRLGCTRREYGNKRAWKISHSSATPMRIEKIVGQMTIGTS